jgi:hypothetical protein
MRLPLGWNPGHGLMGQRPKHGHNDRRSGRPGGMGKPKIRAVSRAWLEVAESRP